MGWTCPQVKEMVQAALGGALFLDEAYALSGGGKVRPWPLLIPRPTGAAGLTLPSHI